jgi:hypothetical protein
MHLSSKRRASNTLWRALTTALVALALTAPRAVRAEGRDTEEKSRFIGLAAEIEGATTGVTWNRVAVDQDRQSVNMVRSSSRGPTIGIGAGLRLLMMTIGPRFRMTSLDGSRLTTIGGELAMSVPIQILEIRASMGGGYASLGHIDQPDPTVGAAPAQGYYARIGLGLHVHATRLIAFGGGVTYEILAVAPSGVSTTDLRSVADEVVTARAEQAWKDVKKMAGAGYGTALSACLSVGLRF